ncbi:MAG TPA: DUF1579 family protein [Acidimicrobiia bacterium]
MQMPLPAVEHAQLARLAGSWQGDETLGPSPWNPQGGVTVGRYHCHMALHDFFLFADYEQENEGAITFRGHGVFSWDSTAGQYVLYWFDSTGFIPGGPATGTWEGDALVLEHPSDQGRARYIWELGEGRFRMRIQSSPDGNVWTTFLDGTYTRA